MGTQTSVRSISTFNAPADPIVNAIIISNTLLDEGQPITIIAQVSGGISPYTYTFIVSNELNPSNIIATNTVSSSSSSESFVWTTNAIGTFVANVIVTDSANVPETTNSAYSVPFSVNAYPIATSLTPSNTILDSGQYVTYNVIINGGTLPITANLIYVAGPSSNNAINGNAPGNVLQTVTLPVGSAEPNIITFNSFELTTQGSYTFNVVAVDSANTPVTFNAVASTITVNPILSVSISPTSNTLNAGQVLPLAMTVTGGTPPFSITYSLSNDLCGSLSATSNTLSADGTNTIVFTANSALYLTCLTTLSASVEDSTSAAVTANAMLTINAAKLTTSTTTSSTSSTTTSTTTISSSTTTIPQITLSLSVLPSGAGSIIFSGNTYQNGTIPVSQGNYSIEAVPANGFQFLSWQNLGGVSLQSNTSATTNVTVNSSGSITALFIPIITFARSGNYIGGNIFAINKHAKIELYGTNTLHSIDITFNTNIRPFTMNVVISNSGTSNFYRIINIYESNTEIDNYVSQAVYNFSVPVSFVKAHGISNGNIELFKQVNNSLVPLPTTYTGTNGTYYFYSAVSNSLSAYKVGFASSSTTGTAFPLELTLPHGFPTYFWTAGVLTSGTGTAAVTYNWTNSSVATFAKSSGGPASRFVANVSVGFSTSATGTVDPDSLEIALAGIGANVIYSSNGINGYIYTTNTPQGTSFSLPYDVQVANSFVILLGSSANNTLSSITYPTGCKQLVDTNGGTTTTVFIANCTQSSGAYTLTVKASKAASIALAAYIFPPYNVILDDNPDTTKITTNGNTYANGSMIQVIGTNGITAIKPTTGNWMFNSWSVSNSLNLSIANTLAPSTFLTVMGNGTVTATWNGITKFIETGLPSGAKWNVTYDSILNSSTTNTIVFSTLPGTYSFTIPIQTINGIPYEPTPSSGSLYSGNTIAITFATKSVTLSFDDNPTTGNIVFNGVTYANGASNTILGDLYTINAIAPSGYIFNNWQSSNSNVTFSNIFESNTTASVTGNSIITANYIAVTLPSNIIYYVPIHLVNNQTTPTPTPFQQMVAVNSIVYKSYEAGNLDNIEFFYANGTIVPSWLEGSTSNTLLNNPTNTIYLNTSSNTIYWVKTISIPASSFITIFMGFASLSNNLFNTATTGEAPTLTSTYAQYDDGAGVFNNYWNFAGTTLPSGWTTTANFTGSVNNGVTITSSSDWAGITQSSASSYSNVIIDAYAEETAHQAFQISLSQAEAYGGSSWQIANGYGFDLDGGGTGYEDILKLVSSSETTLVNGTFNPTLSTYYIVSDYFASPNLKQTVNYNSAALSASDSTFSSLQYLSLTVYKGASWTVNWLRTRAYPPNGVMPSVSFTKAVQANICTITLGASAINFGTINAGSNIATSNAITDTNSGTANAYMFVYGGNWIGPAQFGVSNTTWSAAANTPYSSATRLSSAPSNTFILVPYSSSNSIYFGLGVPGGAPYGAYSQTITIENSC